MCLFSISRGYMLFDQLCDFFRSVAVACYSISCMSISYSMSDLKRVIVVALHFAQRLRTDRGVNLGISIMNLPSEWTLFLNLVDDLLNECESRMYCQDFRVLEGLLERLYGVRSGCNRVANSLGFSAETPGELETISKIKILSESLQGVADCVEKKLYDIDSFAYVSSWLPEAFVDRSGLVGRPRHKTASYAKDTFKENDSRQSPPKSPVRDYLTTELVPPKTRKRKHSYDTIASFEFKRQKTEESILKLEKHLKQKTCPKSLQYKARANIPPDDNFQKEIRAIKNNAEQQFVSALVRFHKRTSHSHAKKLNRAKTARTRNSTDADISHEETQSSERNVKNDVNRIDNLEKQISRIEAILCKHLINNNKRVESRLSKCDL